jgi:hypothetical protein
MLITVSYRNPLITKKNETHTKNLKEKKKLMKRGMKKNENTKTITIIKKVMRNIMKNEVHCIVKLYKNYSEMDS